MSDIEPTIEVETPAADAEATPFAPTDIFTDDKVRAACLEYVCSEITDVKDGSDRADLLERWKKFRRIRRARPETERRSTPWIDAANIEPPLTQQMVHTIWAKEIGAFIGRKPLVAATGTGLGIGDAVRAAALAKFMNHLAQDANGLNWRSNWSRSCYNQTSLGTAMVKVPFLVDEYRLKRPAPDGSIEDVTITRHRAPAYVEIRLEDFYMRPYYKDVNRAPWVAVAYRYFRHEIQQMIANGKFNPDALERIESESVTDYDDNLKEELRLSKIDATGLSSQDPNKEYEIFEANVFWDVDGDGYPEDVILHIEPRSKTLLRAEYNRLPFRDIEPVIYIEDPEAFLGVGVCELCESPQDEVTTLHRMALDGSQLSMQKVIFAKNGCGISKNETISPQKIFFVENPQEDVQIVSFPDIAPSCINLEYLAREYAGRVTGVSDQMSGFNDKVTGSNATVGGTMFLTQQGNTILSAVLERAVQAATNILIKAFYQCVANKELVDVSWMSDAEQKAMQEIFALDITALSRSFKFTISVTDFTKTDEARKQNFLAATTVYTQYGQQMVQLLSSLSNPQAQQMPKLYELFQSLAVGNTKLITKLFEFLDIDSAQDFVPFVDDMQLSLAVADKQRSQQLDQIRGQIDGAEQGTDALGLSSAMGGPAGAGPGPLPGGQGNAPMPSGNMPGGGNPGVA